MNIDAHTLLGLAPGSGADEIKRAFRRLAMRWHPDRNAAPEAAEQFRRLRAAYESLLAAGEEPPPDAAAPAGARGADRHEEIVLTVEEAFAGGDKTFDLAVEAVCTACDGAGEQALVHSRLCTACHGSGRLREHGRLARCGRCDGRGYVRVESCAACTGTGRVRTAHPVAVAVPAGVLDGDELRVTGEGHPDLDGTGRPGDLRLTVRIAPHGLFRLAGRDLRLRRPVSALRMLLGGRLRVPVPGGVREIALAAGAASARVLRIDGAGMPGRHGEPAGALMVELEPVLPAAADGRVRTLVEALEAALAADGDAHWPELAEWERTWLD